MKLLKITTLTAICIILNGCVPLLFFGGGATVGKAVMQERSIGNAVDDVAVWTRIKQAFVGDKENSQAFIKLGVTVLEGRVLLTGRLDNPELRVDALKLVWSQRGVKEVINEITVENFNSDQRSIADIALDTWITAQIKSKIIINKEIKSINYNIETINKIVYLIGIAADENELDLVTSVAGTVKNVEKVISYVRIKDSLVREKMLKTNR